MAGLIGYPKLVSFDGGSGCRSTPSVVLFSNDTLKYILCRGYPSLEESLIGEDMIGLRSDRQGSISRRHVSFCFRNGKWLVCDENGSHNGVYINRHRLTVAKWYVVENGDRVDLCDPDSGTSAASYLFVKPTEKEKEAANAMSTMLEPEILAKQVSATVMRHSEWCFENIKEVLSELISSKMKIINSHSSKRNPGEGLVPENSLVSLSKTNTRSDDCSSKNCNEIHIDHSKLENVVVSRAHDLCNQMRSLPKLSGASESYCCDTLVQNTGQSVTTKPNMTGEIGEIVTKKRKAVECQNCMDNTCTIKLEDVTNETTNNIICFKDHTNNYVSSAKKVRSKMDLELRLKSIHESEGTIDNNLMHDQHDDRNMVNVQQPEVRQNSNDTRSDHEAHTTDKYDKSSPDVNKSIDSAENGYMTPMSNNGDIYCEADVSLNADLFESKESPTAGETAQPLKPTSPSSNFHESDPAAEEPNLTSVECFEMTGELFKKDIISMNEERLDNDTESRELRQKQQEQLLNDDESLFTDSDENPSFREIGNQIIGDNNMNSNFPALPKDKAETTKTTDDEANKSENQCEKEQTLVHKKQETSVRNFGAAQLTSLLRKFTVRPYSTSDSVVETGQS